MSYIILAAVTAHQVNLVLHQRDQWRNDNGHTITYDCRKLVAQTFSSARRHDDKGVVAGQQAFDDLFLGALEAVEAKWCCNSADRSDRFFLDGAFSPLDLTGMRVADCLVDFILDLIVAIIFRWFSEGSEVKIMQPLKEPNSS